MFTPWGPADHQETITEGVVDTSTPSHGGYRTDEKATAKIVRTLEKHGFNPDEVGDLRSTCAWWEEDCAYGAVWLTFPDEIAAARAKWATEWIEPQSVFAHGLSTLEGWFHRFGEPSRADRNRADRNEIVCHVARYSDGPCPYCVAA